MLLSSNLLEYTKVTINIVTGCLVIYNLYYININIIELKEIIENVFQKN